MKPSFVGLLSVCWVLVVSAASAVEHGPKPFDVLTSSWDSHQGADVLRLRAVSQCPDIEIPTREARVFSSISVSSSGALNRELACDNAGSFNLVEGAGVGPCMTQFDYNYVVYDDQLPRPVNWAGAFTSTCFLSGAIAECGGLDANELTVTAQGGIYVVPAVSLDTYVWVDNVLPRTADCISPIGGRTSEPNAVARNTTRRHQGDSAAVRGAVGVKQIQSGPLPAGQAWNGFAVIAAGPLTVHNVGMSGHAYDAAPVYTGGYYKNVLTFVPFFATPTIPINTIGDKLKVSQFDYTFKLVKSAPHQKEKPY